MKRLEAIEKQYKLIRFLCYQLIHFQSDFENEFPLKNANDKEVFDSINELFKTLQDDVFTSADLLNEMFEVERDREGV